MRTKSLCIVAASVVVLIGLYLVADWVWRTSDEVLRAMHDTTGALCRIGAREPVPFGPRLREIRFTDGTSMSFTNGSSYEGHSVAAARTSYEGSCLFVEMQLSRPEKGTAHLAIPFGQIKLVVYEPKLSKPPALDGR